MSSRGGEEEIRNSNWLVASASGFTSELEAANFGGKLKDAFSTAGVVTDIGLDAGIDLPTGRFSQAVKDGVFKESGVTLMDDVHGLVVFRERQKVSFPYVSFTGSVTCDPTPFFACASAHMDIKQAHSTEMRDLILLMNYALLRPDPVARIVLSFSAIEMLGQNCKWTDEQNRLIDQLEAVAASSNLDDSPKSQVLEAIKRIKPKSLRKGVFNLLEDLTIPFLKREWDRLYTRRSELVHGLAPRPGVSYDEYANDVTALCGYIAVKRISQELPGLENYMNTRYASLGLRHNKQ